MDKLMIVRVVLVFVSGFLLFALHKCQSIEKQKDEPKKWVIVITKLLNLALAALITLSITGQVIDVLSRSH